MYHKCGTKCGTHCGTNQGAGGKSIQKICTTKCGTNKTMYHKYHKCGTKCGTYCGTNQGSWGKFNTSIENMYPKMWYKQNYVPHVPQMWYKMWYKLGCMGDKTNTKNLTTKLKDENPKKFLGVKIGGWGPKTRNQY